MAPADRVREDYVQIAPDEEDDIPRPSQPGDDTEDDEDDDAATSQDYSQVSAITAGGKKSGNNSNPDSITATSARRNISSQSIRKGEKDFERDGTRTQQDSLDQSRAVMESVLAYVRVQDDSVSRGWYYPDAWEDEEDEEPSRSSAPNVSSRRFTHTRHRVVLVEVPHGAMFSTVGSVPGKKWIEGLKKEDQPPPRPGYDHVWLLPEEALFMVERGSMELWWPRQTIEATLEWVEERLKKRKKAGESGQGQDKASKKDEPRQEHAEDEITNEEDKWGIPLSLQAAYALLIGSDDTASDDTVYLRGRIPLPHYQVYTHLLRSGYQVQRSVPGLLSEVEETPLQPTSLWQWLFSLFSPALSQSPLQPLSPAGERPFGPLVQPGLYRSYSPIYAQLHLLPRYQPTATSQLVVQPAYTSTPSAPPSTAGNPFRIVFHVWKAGHFGSKSRPGPPDFYMAVGDAHTTEVPTLDQLSGLLDAVPFPTKTSVIGPSRLKQGGETKRPKDSKKSKGNKQSKAIESNKPSSPLPPHAVAPLSKNNFGGFPLIYRRLKLAHRSVLVAVVDHGLVNYMRFGEGAFGEVPLWPRYDGLIASGGRFGRGGGGGKGGNGKGRNGHKGGRGNSKESKEGREAKDGNGVRVASTKRANKV